jgi:hypothetical protein
MGPDERWGEGGYDGGVDQEEGAKMSKERYGVTFQVFDLETGKHVVAGNTRFEVPLQDLVLAFTVLSHAINEHTKKALVKVVKERSEGCEGAKRL